MKVKVINGPNLNMLGIRNPSVYGHMTYKDLVRELQEYAINRHIEVEFFQSNSEGAIIDAIHDSHFNEFNALIINPGAFTHYSYAIRDALESVPNILKVEVHISDIYQRESFRQVNVMKDVVNHSIVGKGIKGYFEALDYIHSKIHRQNEASSL